MAIRPHAVVTGASAGFGLALADALVAAGWRVTTVCRTPQPPAPQRTRVVGDVTDPATARALAAATSDIPVALLVNNAGMSGGRAQLGEVDIADMDASFQLNVVAPLRIVRACRPALAASGSALVINVSSRLASMARQAADHYHQAERRTSYGYRITKAAQNMLSIALAHELAGENVAVWALHPGRLTTRLGMAGADMSPEDAATDAVRLIARRDHADLRPRFISLDPRECPDGGDLPW